MSLEIAILAPLRTPVMHGLVSLHALQKKNHLAPFHDLLQLISSPLSSVAMPSALNKLPDIGARMDFLPRIYTANKARSRELTEYQNKYWQST